MTNARLIMLLLLTLPAVGFRALAADGDDAGTGRENPFAPSEELIRKAAEQHARRTAPADPARAAALPAVARTPELAGFLVCGERVIATFRVGDRYYHVRPDEDFADPLGTVWTFRLDKDGRAALRCGDGREVACPTTPKDTKTE